MVHELGKLIVEASARMQIIITTHSTQLIEEFTERPDAVMVCEKESGTSTFERLNSQELAEWLKNYNLGQLWTSGQLGGNRW
jgi:predicted ATPase